MTADHAGQTGGERALMVLRYLRSAHPGVDLDLVRSAMDDEYRRGLSSRPVPVPGQAAREGQTPAERLMQQVASNGGPYMHPRSVMVVLRALADHTALQGAVRYRRDEPDGDDAATAVGRWLHSVADELWRNL